ncbi:MAG: hypothetical protein OCD02_23265 [Spirochaetaceae bacterium]
MKNIYLFSSVIILFFICNNTVYSDQIHLKIPLIQESPEQNNFYHELLEIALQQNGFTLTLDIIEIPQKRSRIYLENSNISILWMVESKERNSNFIPIKVNITNNLIGKRIFLIKKDNQYKFDNISSLKEFQKLNLVSGFGEGWFDSRVWELNKLRYKEHVGNWRSIYAMLGNDRYYDYFPRGINEIIEDSKIHPNVQPGMIRFVSPAVVKAFWN